MEVEIKEFGVRIRLIVEPYDTADDELKPQCTNEEHVKPMHACIICSDPICLNCANIHKEEVHTEHI